MTNSNLKNKAWERGRNSRCSLGTIPSRPHLLIISEDKKSSTIYFSELNQIFKSSYVVVKGTGTSGRRLLSETSRIVKDETRRLNSSLPATNFDEIWLVFDKDNLNDEQFDNLIEESHNLGYKTAWSNECFELWYLLHFEKYESPMNRQTIFKKLGKKIANIGKQFAGKSYSELKGEKGRELHRAFAKSQLLENSMRRSEEIYLEWNKAGVPFSKRNPATMVFELIKSMEKAKPFCRP